jgi:hypothetical protein
MRLEWEKSDLECLIRAYAYSRRILRDLVHTKGGVNPDASIGSFSADVVDILLGNLVWYHGVSAICLDLPSGKSFEKIR